MSKVTNRVTWTAASQSCIHPGHACLAAMLSASTFHMNPKLKLANIKFVFLAPITIISNELNCH